MEGEFVSWIWSFVPVRRVRHFGTTTTHSFLHAFCTMYNYTTLVSIRYHCISNVLVARRSCHDADERLMRCRGTKLHSPDSGFQGKAQGR